MGGCGTVLEAQWGGSAFGRRVRELPGAVRVIGGSNPNAEYFVEEGMCSFKDNRLGVLDIPCRPYFDALWEQAHQAKLGVALFEAADTLPKHFSLL